MKPIRPLGHAQHGTSERDILYDRNIISLGSGDRRQYTALRGWDLTQEKSFRFARRRMNNSRSSSNLT